MLGPQRVKSDLAKVRSLLAQLRLLIAQEVKNVGQHGPHAGAALGGAGGVNNNVHCAEDVNDQILVDLVESCAEGAEEIRSDSAVERSADGL